MATRVDSDVEQATETSPRRSGGWFTRIQRRIKLAFSGGDDEIILENKTPISWRIYQNYHQLGIIDANERLTLKIVKQGNLNVRPTEGEAVDYLVLALDRGVHRVRIYRRRMAQDVEVYEMSAA